MYAALRSGLGVVSEQEMVTLVFRCCSMLMFQRPRDVNCDVNACFIDYKKAVDKVKHNKLMTILEHIELCKQEA